MGCDIHFVIERKKNDSSWIGVASTDYGYDPKARDRNYSFFAALASVRGESDRKPIGLPEDASDLSLACIKDWDSDGHSHSWMGLKEFVELWYQNAWNADPKRKECAIVDALGWLRDDETPELFRIVFWFDN